MTARPILFSAPMVRAVLDGTKTETRRVVKPQPKVLGKSHGSDEPFIYWKSPRYDNGHGVDYFHTNDEAARRLMLTACPYGAVGDRLWVRESFRLRQDQDHKKPSDDWWKKGAWYEATRTEEPSGCGGGMGKLRPSIFMPRWASRIMLFVTEIRVERLQEIKRHPLDCMREGAYRHTGPLEEYTEIDHEKLAVRAFRRLWDGINAKRGYAWRKNPWVWVVTFRRLSP